MHFLHIAFLVNFTIPKQVLYVPSDAGLVDAENLNYLRLRRPNGLGRGVNTQLNGSALGLIYCRFIFGHFLIHRYL
jgi:hypothetical protein